MPIQKVYTNPMQPNHNTNAAQTAAAATPEATAKADAAASDKIKAKTSNAPLKVTAASSPKPTAAPASTINTAATVATVVMSDGTTISASEAFTKSSQSESDRKSDSAAATKTPWTNAKLERFLKELDPRQRKIIENFSKEIDAFRAVTIRDICKMMLDYTLNNETNETLTIIYYYLRTVLPLVLIRSSSTDELIAEALVTTPDEVGLYYLYQEVVNRLAASRDRLAKELEITPDALETWNHALLSDQVYALELMQRIKLVPSDCHYKSVLNRKLGGEIPTGQLPRIETILLHKKRFEEILKEMEESYSKNIVPTQTEVIEFALDDRRRELLATDLESDSKYESYDPEDATMPDYRPTDDDRYGTPVISLRSPYISRDLYLGNILRNLSSTVRKISTSSKRAKVFEAINLAKARESSAQIVQSVFDDIRNGVTLRKKPDNDGWDE